MSQPDYVYIGPWVDWSFGPVRGATLTLSHTTSGLLIAFIALLVSAAGGGVWKIVSYITHQLRSSRVPRDGLHQQQQNILRNSGSPSEALMGLLQLTRAWRKNADKTLLRSSPLELSAAAFLVLFTLAGIFSSSAIRAVGSDTLARSPFCGVWSQPGTITNDSNGLLSAINQLNSTVSAAAYASTCYTSTPNPLRCNTYTKPTLPFTTNQNASCPFTSGICYYSDNTAYELNTGKLDSDLDFGINTRKEDRVTFQRVTICAPIHTNGYTTIQKGNSTSGTNQAETLIETVYFGGVQDADNNETYIYNNESAAYVDRYTLIYQVAYAGSEDVGWAPVPAFDRPDADVSLFLLSANAIQYVGAVDDPWFSAHVATVVDDSFSYGIQDSLYTSDFLVTAMDCADQYQICNPTNGQCTEMSGITFVGTNIDIIGLNPLQSTIAGHLLSTQSYSDMYFTVYQRGAAALQAQKTSSFAFQVQIPSNQWQIEVSSWFTTGLARLQQVLVDYAAGPPGPLDDGAYITPGNETLCASQKVRSISGTTSLSVVGIAAIVVVCVVLIAISLVLDRISHFIQKRWNHGGYRYKHWLLDGKLQLQRLAYQGASMGTWINLEKDVPITVPGEVFGMLGESNNRDLEERNEIVEESKT